MNTLVRQTRGGKLLPLGRRWWIDASLGPIIEPVRGLSVAGVTDVCHGGCAVAAFEQQLPEDSPRKRETIISHQRNADGPRRPLEKPHETEFRHSCKFDLTGPEREGQAINGFSEYGGALRILNWPCLARHSRAVKWQKSQTIRPKAMCRFELAGDALRTTLSA